LAARLRNLLGSNYKFEKAASNRIAARVLNVGMTRENHRASSKRRHGSDETLGATERMEIYCAAHPGSPTATRHPQLLFRDHLWIALLGPSLEKGITGIGPTIEAALRAFDIQYLTVIRDG